MFTVLTIESGSGFDRTLHMTTETDCTENNFLQPGARLDEKDYNLIKLQQKQSKIGRSLIRASTVRRYRR